MRFLKNSILCLVFILFSSCNVNDVRTIPPETFDVIVYGEVENFDTSAFPNANIAITVHRKGCDSEGVSEGRGGVMESGRFNFVYNSSFGNVDMTCHKAVLMLDDSVLAGPKELNPNFRTEPPLDSTRVDFQFPDDL